MENKNDNSIVQNKEIKVSKAKKKPKQKKADSSFKIRDDMLETIKKYKVDKVFINNSKIKDENILTSLLIHYKVLDYKCYQPKCNVSSEWCGSPMKLMIERINNKNDDLRIKNLRFVCYNCYFMNNSSNIDKLFTKLKKEVVIECKICKYNLTNMPKKYQEMKICKICIKNNTNTTNTFQGKNLFINTFENNLTEEDINNKIESADNLNDLIQLSKQINFKGSIHNNNNNNDQNNINNNHKYKTTKQNNSINRQKSSNKTNKSQLINIEFNDINMEDMKMFSDMINK